MSRAPGGGLHRLEESLGYRFRDQSLLRRAVVHRSYSAERPDEPSYERLEFLGDAVLQMVVTEFVFTEYPDLEEGHMAKVRSASVSGNELALLAAQLELGPHLLLGKGEEASGGRSKSSILADVVEAVLAAVYLDGGLKAAREVILGLWEQRIRVWARQPGRRDFKTRLQELLARRGRQPEYQTVGEGPDHAMTFTSTVEVEGRVVGHGVGSSKKEAEQRAAGQALERLE